jgi:predicted transcriptional regulator
MSVSVRLGIVSHIMRFCETSKEKSRIMQKVGLNDVLAESYLTILTRQSMLVHDNGKYVLTNKGQGYLSSFDRLRKIDSSF